MIENINLLVSDRLDSFYCHGKSLHRFSILHLVQKQEQIWSIGLQGQDIEKNSIDQWTLKTNQIYLLSRRALFLFLILVFKLSCLRWLRVFSVDHVLLFIICSFGYCHVLHTKQLSCSCLFLDLPSKHCLFFVVIYAEKKCMGDDFKRPNRSRGSFLFSSDLSFWNDLCRYFIRPGDI